MMAWIDMSRGEDLDVAEAQDDEWKETTHEDDKKVQDQSQSRENAVWSLFDLRACI